MSQAVIAAVAGVARAPFLLLPVTLVALGAAAAAWDGEASWPRSAVALLGLVGMHVAVNALNEVRDFRSGIDLKTRRTPFSGGSGTLPAGAATPGLATAVAAAGALVGLLTAAWFLSRVGPRLLPILVLGLLATVAYTDLLARHYVGELFAGLGLGALPVLGTAMVQEGEVGPAAIALSVPAFLMTFDLLLLNEFPDEEADRAGGRRNLVLLLGRRGAARLYAAAALGAPLSVIVAVVAGILPPLALLGLAPALLLKRPLRWALVHPEEEVPVPALGANVIWILATNALLAVFLGASRWLDLGAAQALPR